MEPEVIELLDHLRKFVKPIPLRGDSIEILLSPTAFLNAVLDGINSARSRISLATLYAGVGSGAEAEFLQALAAAAHSSSRPDLKLHILVDALRATRPCVSDSNNLTTSTVQEFGKALLHGTAASRTTISLFHTPLLRGLLKQALPPRLREIIGVQHIKAFVFDNNVILTGANLSNSYFSNRQDRAFLFKNAPELSDFLAMALSTIARFSYTLREIDPVCSADALRDVSVRHAQSVNLATHRIGAAMLDACPSGIDPVKNSWQFSTNFRRAMQGIFSPPWENRSDLWNRATSPLQALERHGQLRSRRARQVVDEGNLSRLDDDNDDGDSTKCPPIDWSSADTWLLPTAQAGFAGVQQEEMCTLALLRHAARVGGSVGITTPYLNLGSGYERVLSNASSALGIELLTSSPEANGFFGARGLSGAIPYAYSMLEYRTWRRLVRPAHHPASGSDARCVGDRMPQIPSLSSQGRTIMEYSRPGYEFHAKGIYWTPPGASCPAVTMLGSSNLGRRSLRLDLELQALLATRHKGLREGLKEEWSALREHASPVDASHFRAPGRKSGLVRQVAVRMLRGFL